MAKTPDSQLRAIRNYDAKRGGIAVTIRFTDAEAAELDAARGEQTRPGFVKAVALQAIKERAR
jgi:hypothetical protein